jgi:hypothetical protein
MISASGTLYHAVRSNEGHWHPWQKLPGGPFVSVRPIVGCTDHLELFALGKDDTVALNYLESPADRWKLWINDFQHAPKATAVVARGDGNQLMAYLVGRDDGLVRCIEQHKDQHGKASWASQWERLG